MSSGFPLGCWNPSTPCVIVIRVSQWKGNLIDQELYLNPYKNPQSPHANPPPKN